MIGYDMDYMDPAGPYRYGVFLRPAPQLGLEALKAMKVAYEQFGFTAAMAYPPHTTIMGSLSLKDHNEEALTEAVDKALEGQKPIAVSTPGIVRTPWGIAYELRDDTEDNSKLKELMGSIQKQIDPLLSYPPLDRSVASRRKASPDTYVPHLSIVSHDGLWFPDLADEAFEYLSEAQIGKGGNYLANYVTLYRFRSEDWTGRYWETMQWMIVKSWKLKA